MQKKLFSTPCLVVVFVALFLAGQVPFVLSQTEPVHDGRYYESIARKAYQAKDYPAFLENMKLALQLRPNHPRLTYNLAIANALNGRTDDALDWLDKVIRMGMIVPADADPDFASVRDNPRFKTILARIESNKAHSGTSQTAFTLHEKGVVPESVAYDPRTKAFFLSSIYKRKIIRIDAKGVASDLATEADGLWSVFGMRVDADRRILWACTAAHPQMSHYNAAENGTSAILKFDLKTGKLLKKYLLPNATGQHLLGDMVLNSRGDVFASDSISPEIYVIRQGASEMELFLRSSDFSSPQGLAFSSDERSLFLADYSNGIFSIDVATKRITNFPAPSGSTLLGIDGLYSYNGSLIAVQNGVNPQRIIRLSMKPGDTGIDRLDVIEANNPVFDEPTLGVMIKDSFYYIANSQWGAIDEKGTLAPPEKLKDPVVLKIDLPH